MWTSEIVGLTHGTFSLESIVDSEYNLIDENWLDFGVHVIDDEVHPVEHFHLHTPFGGNGVIWFDSVEHVSWSQDSDVWEDLFHFLLTNPFGSESHALGVWVCISGRNVN